MRDRFELPVPFEILDEEHGSTVVLGVLGELDIAHAPKLAVAVNEALRRQTDRLVIDLCATNFVDSTGLAVLLNARRRTVRAGIGMRLACDVPSILRLLRLTRLDREFAIYASRRDALALSSSASRSGSETVTVSSP